MTSYMQTRRRISIFSIILCVSLISAWDLITSNTDPSGRPPMPTPRWVEVANTIPQPAGMMDTQNLIALAYGMGGMHTVEAVDYTWTTYGAWMGEIGISGGVVSADIPVLVVAMRGRGGWTGAGFVPPDFEITGETIAVFGDTGYPISHFGGYELPTGENSVIYRQSIGRPTRESVTPEPTRFALAK